MIRMFGIELRRSSALGAALILVVAGIATLYVTPQRWSHGWMSLAMTQREYLALLSPLAMAAGAWQSFREHRSHVAELFASVPRPRPQRILPILGATALAVVVAYLVVLAGAIPRLLGTAGYLPVAAFAVTAVGLLAMIASVWIGLAVGRLVPALATAPALAVAGFALQTFAPQAFDNPWLFAAFSPSMGMSQFSDYTTVPGRLTVGQGVWIAALGVAAFVLFAVRGRRAGVAALAPLAVGAAATVLVLPTGSDFGRATVDPVAQELVCTNDAPRICVSRVHESLLPDVTRSARRALTALAKVPGLPVTEAHEDTTTYLPLVMPAPRAGTALMDVGVDKDGGLAHPGRFQTTLLTNVFAGPRTCTEVNNYGAAHAAALWVLGTDTGLTDPDPEAVALWHHLRQRPDAADRLAAAYRAAWRCQDAAAVLEAR
ncbi:hypothetical protein [Cryptosporangium sp. NPDC051539]|uniref:hypothetical protein n=1 Tax=Cryptosporangium sp. NPDC051539 TaxID=3363962 RepID=UPI0037AF668D